MSSSVSGFGFSSASSGIKDSSNTGSGGGTGPSGNANLGTADWIRRPNGTNTSSSNSTNNAGGSSSNSGSGTTHRRPSLSTTLTHNHNHSASTSTPLSSTASNVYQPPHHFNSQSQQPQTQRYSKEELLDIWKNLDKNAMQKDVLKLLGDWHTGGSEPGGPTAWGRSGDEAVANGAEVCWEKNGGLKPMSLQEMDEAEKELFSGNINSLQKIPQNQNMQTPQGNRTGNPGNKQGNRRNDGENQGTPTRAMNRRREPSDVGPGSPLHSNSPGLPGTLSRRGTGLRAGAGDDSETQSRHHNFSRWGPKDSSADQQEDSKDKDKEKDAKDSTGGRTGGLFRRPSAAWGSNAGSGAMGSFGSAPATGVFGGGMGGFTLIADNKKKAGASQSSTKSKNDEGGDVDNRNASNGPQGISNLSREKDDDNRPMTSDTDPFARGSSVADSPQSNAGSRGATRTASPGNLDSLGLQNKASFGSFARDQASASKLREELGFSGMRTANFAGLAGLNTQFGQLGLGSPGQGERGNELSPTETNPYQSPLTEKIEDDDIDSGLGAIGVGLRRGQGSAIGDSSVGSRSGKNSVSGLSAGGLGGLGTIGTGIGTQSLSSVTGSSVWGTGSGLMTPLGNISSGANPGLGGGFFGGLGDVSGGLGGVGTPGGTAFNSMGRASRLGSLFNSMEQGGAQQHLDDDGHSNPLDRQDSFDSLRLGAMGAGIGATGGRRNLGNLGHYATDIGERADINAFGPLTSRNLGMFSGNENPLFSGFGGIQSQLLEQRSDPMLHQSSLHQATSHPNLPRGGIGQLSSVSSANTPAATATSSLTTPTLVMPDKMQWEYRDPSGTIQGPFSGLDMHEWYKAGFFTSDLNIKRVEDTDFEPLGNFVRRIGNQREPFLVPMPSLIPNIPITPATNATWGGATTATPGWPEAVPNQSTPGVQQPPFASNFPSFGTTLTAEQQNALERRKQEEQYLMARQREYLMHQQVIAKQMAAAQQHQLQHQGSSHSLHSQASLGSLTGQATSLFPQTPSAGGMGAGEGFAQNDMQHVGQFPLGQQSQIQQFTQPIEPPFGQTPADQPSVTTDDSQPPTSQPQQQTQESAEEQAAQPSGAQQANPSPSDKVEDEATAAASEKAAPAAPAASESKPGVSSSSVTPSVTASSTVQPSTIAVSSAPSAPSVQTAPRNDNQRKVTSPKPLSLATSAWNDNNSALPLPFPPPPSAKAEQSATTPLVETPSAPSVAPWAKEVEAAPKGPSLKEIQELEAKQAALEAEREKAKQLALAEQQAAASVNVTTTAAPAPGLPSTATWASPSPQPANSPSAWVKPLAKNAPTAPKKTLQQIQKEEEARKAKAAQAAAQATATANLSASIAAGKRYADLAGKPATTIAAPGGAWTTVGASGKTKASSVASSPAPLTRPPLAPTASLGLVKNTKPAAKPAAPVNNAHEEFMKWSRASLKGLNPQVNVEDFLQSLLSFPADAELIADSVYASSTTIDGRRFADEFIKRRKAATAGIVMEAGDGLATIGGSQDKAGGWNEVAKKNASHLPKDVPETNAAFKVVPGKKRTKRA